MIIITPINSYRVKLVFTALMVSKAISTHGEKVIIQDLAQLFITIYQEGGVHGRGKCWMCQAYRRPGGRTK